MGSAVLLASIGSHVLVAALDMQTQAASGHKRFGGTRGPALGLLAASSITYDGLDWNRIADALSVAIESWPVPGSSPAEWEQLQRRSPQARHTFVGVSLYDLNEPWLCDFRAELVPFSQTIDDLWESHSDVQFARRVSSRYPRAWARTLFPTAGRSDRVILGLRERARTLAGLADASADQEPKLRLAADYTSDSSITDWPQDRLLRRLAEMRTAQGKPWFSGPKHLALARLMGQARRQGTVTVIVLPVSAPYVQGLLSRDDRREFEVSLADLKRRVPEARWVRLDQLQALESADLFYDLVHLNMRGRQVATGGFLGALAEVVSGQ